MVIVLNHVRGGASTPPALNLTTGHSQTFWLAGAGLGAIAGAAFRSLGQ